MKTLPSQYFRKPRLNEVDRYYRILVDYDRHATEAPVHDNYLNKMFAREYNFIKVFWAVREFRNRKCDGRITGNFLLASLGLLWWSSKYIFSCVQWILFMLPWEFRKRYLTQWLWWTQGQYSEIRPNLLSSYSYFLHWSFVSLIQITMLFPQAVIRSRIQYQKAVNLYRWKNKYPSVYLPIDRSVVRNTHPVCINSVHAADIKLPWFPNS